jgi:hypothetical protein
MISPIIKLTSRPATLKASILHRSAFKNLSAHGGGVVVVSSAAFYGGSGIECCILRW